MRIRFWGTRGSLPVALTSAAVKQKLVSMLLKAMGKPLDTAARIEAYVEQEGPTPYTFGGSSSCVQIDVGGDEYVLCDLGSGVRAFGSHLLATHGPAKADTVPVFISPLPL